MNSTIATVFEYQNYSFKLGNENRFDKNGFVFTKSTFDALKELNREKRFLVLKQDKLNPRNLVGVVKVENLTIQIFPKLFKENLEEHENIIARNVLKMFSYSNNFPVKNVDKSDLITDDIDFFEIFINLFAKNLLPLLKNNCHRNYIKQSQNLHFVREKIDAKKYGNPAKLHIIPCTFHKFSMDTKLNKTLKYTSYLMAKKVESIENFQLLKEIINILDEVPLEPVTLEDINEISFNRLNERFEPFIEICKIFLQNCALSLQASQIDTFALLIPMEKLFEEFISNLLQQNKEYFFGPSVRISKQKGIGHLATLLNIKDGKMTPKKSEFKLVPDILIKRNNEKYIIDTKYRILNKNKSKLGILQGTLYQMYAYATKTCAKCIILLYPDLGADLSSSWKIEYNSGEDTTFLHAKCVNLSYDLCDEDQENDFKAEFKQTLESTFELCPTQ